MFVPSLTVTLSHAVLTVARAGHSIRPQSWVPRGRFWKMPSGIETFCNWFVTSQSTCVPPEVIDDHLPILDRSSLGFDASICNFQVEWLTGCDTHVFPAARPNAGCPHPRQAESVSGSFGE